MYTGLIEFPILYNMYVNVDPLLVTLSGSGGAKIAGENYTLSCTLTGGGTVTTTYQWWKDDALLINKIASTIAFRPLRESNSGVSATSVRAL